MRLATAIRPSMNSQQKRAIGCDATLAQTCPDQQRTTTTTTTAQPHDGAWTEAVPARDRQENCQGACQHQPEPQCGCIDLPRLSAVHAITRQRGGHRDEARRRARHHGTERQESHGGRRAQVQGINPWMPVREKTTL